MITHVCVAIQLLGAAAAPDAVQALQQHCDSVLGAGECRMARDGSSDGKTECWRATLVRTVDDVMASIVVDGSDAAAGHVAQRDVTFQSNDERTDRWATLGLVIAALVTQQEHAAASTPPATATAAPAAEPRPPTGSHWFSRDRSETEPATISEELESSHELLHLADVRLLAVADVGRLPWATVGARLAATSGVTRYLDVEIGFAYLASTGAAAIPMSAGGGGVHFNLLSATLGLCPRSRVNTRLTGHVCLGGDVAEMTATAFGPAQPERAHAWLPNAWVGFDSALRLTRHLALVAEFKTELAVTGPPLIVGAGTAIFQASRLTENVAFGIAGTF